MQERVVTNDMFAYFRTTDNNAKEFLQYFRERSKARLNIASMSISRNGFVRVPTVCNPETLGILEEFCRLKDIELIHAERVENKGRGLIELLKFYEEV